MTDLEIASLLRPLFAPCLERNILAVSGDAGDHAAYRAWKALPVDYIRRFEKAVGCLELIVAGTPGGGTAFLARLLTACGKRAGHESVFQCSGIPRLGRLETEGFEIEVSGFAAQWLLTYQPRVFLVRHPLGAIHSMQKHFQWSPATAAAYWTGVAGLALRRRTYHKEPVVLLERALPWVAALTGSPLEYVEAKAERIDRNQHPPPPGFRPVTWEELPADCRYVASQLGYTKEG